MKKGRSNPALFFIVDTAKIQLTGHIVGPRQSGTRADLHARLAIQKSLPDMVNSWSDFTGHTRDSAQTEPPNPIAGIAAQLLDDALPQLVWSARADGVADYVNGQWCRYTGSTADAGLGSGWLDFIHSEDAVHTSQAWRRAITTGDPFDNEFRLRDAQGCYRWMVGRALPVRDEAGRITRWIGTCTDIDARARSGDLMEFMSRELSHRIKNLFALVQSLISMALRKHPDMAQVSQGLQARMVALGRAHDLVRPRIAEGSIGPSQTTLRHLIEVLTLPFAQDDPARVQLTGDDTVVEERATTPLALFFHEMAINSALFGALSTAQGKLHIAIAVGDDIAVDWQELGGPTIGDAPVPAFGLGLTRLTIERQLGGKLTMDWQEQGLHAIARIPLRQVSAT